MFYCLRGVCLGLLGSEEKPKGFSYIERAADIGLAEVRWVFPCSFQNFTLMGGWCGFPQFPFSSFVLRINYSGGFKILIVQYLTRIKGIYRLHPCRYARKSDILHDIVQRNLSFNLDV